MSLIESVHMDHGASFDTRGGRRVVDNYGRPERTHRAVRNSAGLIELAYDVVVVTGTDRIEYVDNVVSNTVPIAEDTGCYALVLNPQGRIELEMYIYNMGERLVLLTQPGTGEELVAEWSDKVFIQDVEISLETDAYAIFGVHGPHATEKIASVLNGSSSPDQRYAVARGSMNDIGVTVIRTDALTGEESYEVICAASEAATVYDTLLNRGMNAAPFGYQTFDLLSLEAGSPLFETELEGRIPNVLGLRNAVDFEKGCFVGQEVVSRVENRGQPSQRLVGLTCETVDPPASGTSIFDGETSVGELTRATYSSVLEETIGLALVPYDFDNETVRVGGKGGISARVTTLPFYTGTEQSARLPAYPQ